LQLESTELAIVTSLEAQNTRSLPFWKPEFTIIAILKILRTFQKLLEDFYRISEKLLRDFGSVRG
jgi:hypothetical protein